MVKDVVGWILQAYYRNPAEAKRRYQEAFGVAVTDPSHEEQLWRLFEKAREEGESLVMPPQLTLAFLLRKKRGGKPDKLGGKRGRPSDFEWRRRLGRYDRWRKKVLIARGVDATTAEARAAKVVARVYRFVKPPPTADFVQDECIKRKSPRKRPRREKSGPPAESTPPPLARGGISRA